MQKIANYPIGLRLIIFVGALLALWLPFAIPIYWLVSDQNLVSIITMVILYLEFIYLLRWWGRKVYRQHDLIATYGLQLTPYHWQDFYQGLTLGCVGVLMLFWVQGALGWVMWRDPFLNFDSFLQFGQIGLEGLLVGVAVGMAEELLFRGWLLDELQRDFLPQLAMWINSSLFALVHFIKPVADMIRTLPQFPGLLLLGLTLIWAKRSTQGRLGLSIGLHGGLIWGYYVIDVGKLISYTGQMADWVVGVNRNPLAGIMGLGCLGAIAFWTTHKSQQHS